MEKNRKNRKERNADMAQYNGKIAPITTDQLWVAAIAMTAKMETISDLAERFDEQQDVTGIVSCILAITELINEKDALTANVAQKPEDPYSEEEWENTRAQAQEMMEREAHRSDDVRYRDSSHHPPEPSEGEIAAAGLALSVMAALAHIAAAERLGQIMADQDEQDGARWSAFGIAQAMAHETPDWEEIEDAMERPEWTAAPGVRDEIRKLICGPADHPHNPCGPLRTRARDLCREYGIEHPSEEALDRPGVISDLVLSRDPGRRYQLSLEMGAPNESFVDVVMFRYRDETYVKTVGEPFPRGFPGPTALEIAREFLRMCAEPGRQPDGAGWRMHRETGLSAARAAQAGLHDLDRSNVGDLIESLEEIFPERSDMTMHVMRIITGRDQGVQDIILPRGLATQPLARRNDITRLVSAARKAGLRKTEMWELARFLGMDPGSHGIERPEMDPETAERVGRAMLTAGIPESAMSSVLEELAGEN